MAALQAMLRAPKSDVEARLGAVRAPTLVVMGTKDPDFPDPAAEAAIVAGLLHGAVAMVEGVGHYPHAEAPEVAAPLILGFLARNAAG
jgi:pimeloyl-ACP methyl ester carboxylesterase